MKEAKKMKCYKRLIYKQFVQVSGLCGPQFLSYLPKRFTHLCRALYGDAILVHRFGAPINMAAGNHQKHLEFTFSIKALVFHSRTRLLAHKHLLIFEMVILSKIQLCKFHEKVRQYCINKFVRTTLLSKNIILFENNTYILVKKFGRRTLRRSHESVKQYIYS